MNITINRITLGIASIERATQFYDEWLGIEPFELSRNQALYNLDNLILVFELLGTLADDAEVNDESEGFSGIILSRYVNSIEEVDQMIKIAVEIGAYVTKRATTTRKNTYSGYFSDLDGYMWEVAFQLPKN